MSEPVTVLVTRRVRAGQEQAFTAWLSELAQMAARYPGHQGVTEIAPPESAIDLEYVIVFRFDSQAHLRVWQASDERRAMLARSASMADEPPQERELTGLETWFATPGGQVRRSPLPWKMWLLSSVAIYPLITMLSLALAPLAAVPLPIRLAITTPVLGALMTWIVMPRLSRLVSSWLYT